MKINKMFVAFFAATAVLLSAVGCTAEMDKFHGQTGEDPSLPGIENFQFNVANSSATSMVVSYDNSKALAAGATAFNVQILTDCGEDACGDNYDSKTAKIISAESDNNDICQFTNLTTGDVYYIRARVLYTNSRYSCWSWLTDGAGNPVACHVGIGPEIEMPATVKARATDTKIKLSWNSSPLDCVYDVYYKEASAADWTKVATAISDTYCEISGLKFETEYEVKVVAVFTASEIEKETVISVTTLAEFKYPVVVNNLQALLDIFDVPDMLANANATDVITLATDLDFSGVDVPEGLVYTGILDGAGHKIKNYVSDHPLFESVEGVVKDLTFESSCKIDFVGDGDCGMLAGKSKATITNVVNKGSIVCTTGSVAASRVGGVVGNTLGGKVSDCSNSGNITINATSADDRVYVGGVVGRAQDPDSAPVPDAVAVENCSNSGNISLSYSGTPKASVIGGVVGGSGGYHSASAAFSYGILKGLTNTGNVSLEIGVNNSGTYTNIGGVVGYWEGAIENLTNEGEVSLAANADPAAACTRPSIGGVAGYVFYGAKDCLNKGEVKASGAFAAGTADAAGAGGLHQPHFAGVIGGAGPAATNTDYEIKNCHNEGKLTFHAVQKLAGGTKANLAGVVAFSSLPVVDCTNKGDIDCKDGHKVYYLGGIVGDPLSKVENCVNEAAINCDALGDNPHANGTDFFAYQLYIGGIAGYPGVKGVELIGCENKGDVTLTNAWCQAVLTYVGGINGSYNSTTVMTNCINRGNVLVDAPTAAMVGGLSGGFNGTMTGCENHGNVTAKGCKGISGKEPSVGALIGYANCEVHSCVAAGTITNDCGGASQASLFVAEMGDASKTWSGNTIQGQLVAGSNATSVGVVLGRFRNAGTNVITAGTAEAPFVVKATATVNGAPASGASLIGGGGSVDSTNLVFE